MSQYFPKPYDSFGGEINVKVDLCNYATKTDLKNISHLDASSFALKSNLANLNTEVDKLDLNKLTPVPNDLAKLSNVVKNDVVKKAVYEKLVAKVNNFGTKRFPLKTKHDTDKSDLEKNINDADKKDPDTRDLAKKTDLDAKITKIEGKIPSITDLAINSALTAIENKIPNVSNLVKKTYSITKISEIETNYHNKFITTPECNNLAAGICTARLAQADLVTKTDFDTKLQSFNKKIISNKTKNLLVETELKNLEKFDAVYFRGRNYFDGDGTQNYLVFQPVYKYFETVGSETSSWESKGLYSEKISSVTTSDGRVSKLLYDNVSIKVKFNGDLLKQNKVTYNHGPIVNIYIVYRLTSTTKDSIVTLQDCLFGAVKLTRKC